MRYEYQALRCVGGILVILLALAGRPFVVRAQDPAQPELTLLQIVAPTSQQRTTLIRLGLDVFHADERGVIGLATPAQRQAIKRAGFAFQVFPQYVLYPAVDKAYHYYPGAVSEMQRIASQYPEITRLLPIGTTAHSRPIYALNISDPTDGPTEPGVLIFALTHAREHLTIELALYIIRILTTEYGVNSAITNLVNQRDIWIIPVLNPDGNVYDIESGFYQNWRKNRRLNSDGTYGVDLNRNFGYRWACCGGSSGWPSDWEYRGPAPFSELETSALRDFVLARPHLRTSLSLHSYSELILWPFGYTRDPLPADMNPTDYRAFVAIGREMARRNGYSPRQASQLYITDGSSDDWLYAERGIFAFTMELYPRSEIPGFYPPGNVIERETLRNRSAIEYFLSVSAYPRQAAGEPGDASPPQVQIVEPAAGARPSGPLRLRAQAEDNVAVTLVEFLADGRSIGLDAQPPFEIIWRNPPRAGVISLQARAFDAAQNIAASALVTVELHLTQRLPLIQAASAPEP